MKEHLSYMVHKIRYDHERSEQMNYYSPYPCPYYNTVPMYDPNAHSAYDVYLYPFWGKTPMYKPNHWPRYMELKDYGPDPLVINIEDATKENNTFRTALWTGKYLQLTLMSIDVGDNIGLEMHSDLDQFIRIEEGQGIVRMGDERNNLNFQARIYDDFVIFIPAGKWHNLINTGNKPIKLYSIYAPPAHPHGTVHRTKADAEENHH